MPLPLLCLVLLVWQWKNSLRQRHEFLLFLVQWQTIINIEQILTHWCSCCLCNLFWELVQHGIHQSHHVHLHCPRFSVIQCHSQTFMSFSSCGLDLSHFWVSTHLFCPCHKFIHSLGCTWLTFRSSMCQTIACCFSFAFLCAGHGLHSWW